MKVLVIGATGHIGTYLVPRLVESGCEVIAVSRGNREPYSLKPAWKSVRRVILDRKAEDRTGNFGGKIAALGADVVVDLLLFRPESLPQLVDSLAGRIGQFVFCGTMWVYGPTEQAPSTEQAPRRPIGDYGRDKAALERELIGLARSGKFPASVLHPGHIVGTGWPPVNPAGNLDLAVFEKLGTGEPVCLPDLGLATLHHVHADDVAQAFQLAVLGPRSAIGENFNVVSPEALSLRGFCRAVASWFGLEPSLTYLPWDQWKETVSGSDAEETWEHISHSPCGSIEKARRLLGYCPRYSSLQAVRESLAWLIDHGKVSLPPLS